MHVESDARKELHGRLFQLCAVSGTFNFPRQGFHPEGEIPRRHSSNSRVC